VAAVMAGFKLIFKTARGQFERGMKDMYRPVAKTATRGMTELALRWKLAGRQNIARAGFSRKWQNALRGQAFPRLPKSSAEAAAFVNHRVTYAEVFEKGLTIRGSPILWVPMDHVPKKVNRQATTADRLIQAIGQKPISINPPGKPPMLAAVIRGPKKSRAKKVSLAALKRGKTGSKGVIKRIPLFIGAESIKEPNLLDLEKIHDSFASQVAKFYVRNFKDE